LFNFLVSTQNFFTDEEEFLMNKILEKYSLDVSESQRCVTILNSEVEKKDIENIHEILLKQEQWNGVIAQLTVAERQLSFYFIISDSLRLHEIMAH
jgi:hypothetical protein